MDGVVGGGVDVQNAVVWVGGTKKDQHNMSISQMELP
jgi:hypothetical protein